MNKKQALIVGALGGIGRNLIEYLSSLEDWEIIGLARREPNFESRAKFISVDLLDRDDVQTKLSSLSNRPLAKVKK
jgi:nucleoside-diphosphate-sugar epimerase